MIKFLSHLLDGNPLYLNIYNLAIKNINGRAIGIKMLKEMDLWEKILVLEVLYLFNYKSWKKTGLTSV